MVIPWFDHLNREMIQKLYRMDSLANPEGGHGVWTPTPLKNHKNIGFLSNTGPDLLNHTPVFNVCGLLLVKTALSGVLILPSSTKEEKKNVKKTQKRC